MLLIANIRRAVNGKMTKDALPLSLREKLGACGRLGDVAVVVTQADVLNKSEVAANLGCEQSTIAVVVLVDSSTLPL